MLPSKRSKPNQATEEKQAQDRYAALLKSIESFSTDLYQCIADNEEGNFVSSGLNVHLVLSMCALGAKGNTAKEMLDVLHMGQDNLSSGFKMLITDLKDIRHIQLNVINKILADKSIVIKECFKDSIQDLFLADVVDVDFALQHKQVVEKINKWCAQQTENNIKEILSEDDVDPLTKMILANAVYFKALWADRFGCEVTREKPFFTDTDNTINVLTMHISETFMYKDLKRLNAECIAIPYANRDYLFVVIKPKDIDGLKQLETNLKKIKLDYNEAGKENNFECRNIHLALPKFKIESKIDLNDYLAKLGMVEMFTEQADFKGMSEKPILIPPLHVDKVLQKAFIEVNEIGTEAAAFTVSVQKGGGPGLPKQWHDFEVDRPFLYRIVKKSSNLTLFSGRVIKPECDKFRFPYKIDTHYNRL